MIKTIYTQLQKEGVGAKVRRSIGSFELPNLDPFLMMDEFFLEPPTGFPDHPHRGFEALTYMLNGKVSHSDNRGHQGTIEKGDMQLMKVGKGIIHSEMCSSTNTHGMQLWINLPIKNKMDEATYHEKKHSDLLFEKKEGITIKTVLNKIETCMEAMVLDINLETNKDYECLGLDTHSTFIYLLEGELKINATKLNEHGLAVVNGPVTVHALKNSRFLFATAKKTHEPIVQHGPFVMTTQQEIMTTFVDYQLARNGFERRIAF